LSNLSSSHPFYFLNSDNSLLNLINPALKFHIALNIRTPNTSILQGFFIFPLAPELKCSSLWYTRSEKLNPLLSRTIHLTSGLLFSGSFFYSIYLSINSFLGIDLLDETNITAFPSISFGNNLPSDLFLSFII
jgi:hypothetical protein